MLRLRLYTHRLFVLLVLDSRGFIMVKAEYIRIVWLALFCYLALC